MEHFAMDIAVLRGVDIRLPLGLGLDLQLVENMAMVLYNPHRCYLQVGKPQTKLLQPSHLPPMKVRRLRDPEDEQAVRSVLVMWHVFEHSRHDGSIFYTLSLDLDHLSIGNTLNWAVVEFPTRQTQWERPGHNFRGIHQITDWRERARERAREQLEDWRQWGREVTSEATSDEDYFRAYARRFGAQVYRGTRRPRAELERAQQMVGGASTSRDEPGRSVLEGQLAAAVTRAEEAMALLLEREAELRDSLAWTAALETEMAEVHLHPQADEVTGLF
ncbi:hypothetical protein Taro_049941 [Colocasia esculenta]|uniref:Uncharacterized protein n=1 Tax=Colocasia esculenta TaxID=4460 RepID=A0A843XCM7_COLES|nr:hypothetical protein [Colocasia esculenta]